MGHFSQAKSLETVEQDLFKKGDFFVWAFSEYDKSISQWKEPYLYEKYTVTDVEGDVVTVEMSSDSQPNSSSASHHKFKANIKECLSLGASKNSMKKWKVSFYTKSFGPQWELVSKKHKGLVFTEKFNCLSDNVEVESGAVSWDGDWNISSEKLKKVKSWYFTDHPVLKGVTYRKVFGAYKLELEMTSLVY